MAKKVVMVLGVVLLLIGIIGFFNNPILGIFGVDTIHNVVHLVSGLLALLATVNGESASKMFAKIFGIIYALLGVLGFLMASPLLGFLMVNPADNVLHLIVGIVLLGAAFMGGKEQGSMQAA